MRGRVDRVVRRVLLVAAVASGSAAVVVCSAGPVFPQTEGAGAGCDDCSGGGAGAVSPEEPSPPPAEVTGRGTPSTGGGGRASSRANDDGAFVETIHDPTGDALDAFYQSLAEVERADGDEGPVTRISFFGDSHTAADLMTGHLRRLLQRRFGDAGHGFIAAGRPFRSYRHVDIEGGESGRWEGYRVRHPRGRAPEEMDRLLGLAGLAVESEHRGSAVWVRTSNRGPVGHTASRFELFYLAQPRGGRMEVSLDGTSLARLSTRAPEATAAYYVTETMDGPHELRIEAGGGGLVRLFGVAVERPGPGVVLDSLGINGARVTTILAPDRELLSEHIAQRQPDLIVLWYGTNEVGDDWYDVEQYEQWVIDAITTVRRAAPGASCLFVAPPDMGRASLAEPAEELATPARLLRIMAAQRDAAELVGCAHWSSFDAMGGRDSIVAWSQNDPPLAGRDGIHLTRPGYELIAEALYGALIDGYEQHLERHSADESS